MRSQTFYNEDGTVKAEYVNGELVRGTDFDNSRGHTFPGIQIFRDGPYEHIAADPINIKSKADLRAITRDHNCTSDYAE